MYLTFNLFFYPLLKKVYVIKMTYFEKICFVKKSFKSLINFNKQVVQIICTFYVEVILFDAVLRTSEI